MYFLCDYYELLVKVEECEVLEGWGDPFPHCHALQLHVPYVIDITYGRLVGMTLKCPQ